MKIRPILAIANISLLAVTGCDRHSPDIAGKIAELEQKNKEASERQLELERQLEDQKLAVERDAIERERAQIEVDRAELERRQGEAQAEKDETLQTREEALARREGKLEQQQASLEEKQGDLDSRAQNLSEKDRDLAGREALPFEQPEQNVPVGDYGTFYDTLSSYGSWFETQDYGYVWQPAVIREADWRPYSRGRWVCSDRGWNWLSDEPFGWATYHYGRWARIHGHGWIWVPGSEWAPCWVSWRSNDSHIGWAPLPPETLAWRGRGWDNSVDIQFGIGAVCFNFVEIRYFGGPLHRRCLPISGNPGWFGNTTNITYIHITNRQVICGGPRYKTVSDRIGKPLPFYRLEVDQHPRISNGHLELRPQAHGGRLPVAAPNMDAAWNDGLKPKQIRGRIETVSVERTTTLSREIIEKVVQSRDEARQRAEKSITDLGGREHFEERRTEQLRDNRRTLEGTPPLNRTSDVAPKPEAPQVRNPERKDQPQVVAPRERNSLPNGIARGSDSKPVLTGDQERNSENLEKHVIAPPPQERPDKVKQPESRKSNEVQRDIASGREKAIRQQQDEARQAQQRLTDQTRKIEDENARRREGKSSEQNGAQEKQRQADEAQQTQEEAERRNENRQAEHAKEMKRQTDEARQVQQEEEIRKQQDSARQKLDQAKQQREQQTLEARRQAAEQEFEQARQQDAARENARRQQQELQQREMQRQQQEAAREEGRRQQQEQQQREMQRQQQESQQRRQSEQTQQREQEQARQQQEQARQQRQQQDDSQNDSRRKNR